MAEVGGGRVIVGVDGSPESIRALRVAGEWARRRHTRLLVVNVAAGGRGRLPVIRQVGDGVGLQWRPRRPGHQDQSWRTIADCLHQGFGGDPEGVEVHRFIQVGRPGPALTALAWRPDDLLVVGHRRGPGHRSTPRGSVSRYCAAHAACSVLVVATEQPHRPTPGRASTPPQAASGAAKAA